MEVPCPLMTPTVEFSLSMLDMTRHRMLKLVEGLTSEQLLRVPTGFHNNLLWNLGHVIAVQQSLCYERIELPLRVPSYLIAPFRKGTHPGEWTGTMDLEDIKTWLMESLRVLREDLHKNVFATFTPYETGTATKLASISDILSFDTWHEAMHLGTMMAMFKLVKA
jgi:hypothetical protein